MIVVLAPYIGGYLGGAGLELWVSDILGIPFDIFFESIVAIFLSICNMSVVSTPARGVMQ